MVSFVPAAAIVVVLAALALMVSSAALRRPGRHPSGPLAGPGLDGRRRSRLPAVGDRRGVGRPGAPSPCSGCRSRPPRRRRGPRSSGSPPGPSAARPWPAASPWPRWPPWSWPGVTASGGPGDSGPSPSSSGWWPGSSVRGWTGSLAVDPLVLLAPAAVAVAAAIGLGRGGVRGGPPGGRVRLAAAGHGGGHRGRSVLGALPTAISALPGRWDLPINDFSQSVAWMRAKSADGAFRVLWLGNTNAIYQGSWAAGDGLAYATSENGGPDARWLWNAAGPGPASGLASAVDLARDGGTDRLGRLLAPSGVRYVALLTSLAPEINGEQTPHGVPGPGRRGPGAHPAARPQPCPLGHRHHRLPQQRLAAPAGRGPRRARRCPTRPSPIPWPGARARGWCPARCAVLPGPAAPVVPGPLTKGTVLAASAPRPAGGP